MSTEIPQRELRNQNAELMRRVARGESFVITSHGVPVAELRPITDSRRRFVRLDELIAANLPTIDSDAFFEDLDAIVDQDL